MTQQSMTMKIGIVSTEVFMVIASAARGLGLIKCINILIDLLKKYVFCIFQIEFEIQK